VQVTQNVTKHFLLLLLVGWKVSKANVCENYTPAGQQKLELFLEGELLYKLPAILEENSLLYTYKHGKCN
jgi:hypothetical protein